MDLPFRLPPVWPRPPFGDVWGPIIKGQVLEVLGELNAGTSGPSVRFMEDTALPLSGWLAQRARSGPFVAAFSGPPGCGKSTLVGVLGVLLDRLFGLKTAGFSLDDVYLTKAERQALACDVHPLLRTRGVPGTHDLDLAHRCLDALFSASASHRILLPRFDKLADDRAPQDEWETVNDRVDVVLLDGWCWGALPGQERDLERPLNQREREEDPRGTWRRWVRRQLAGPYARLFARADVHARLVSPSWQTTIDWRIDQELALLGQDGPAKEELRARVTHFLDLFQRVASLPVKTPELTLALDQRHELHRVWGPLLGQA